jgi:hypothetical protein
MLLGLNDEVSNASENSNVAGGSVVTNEYLGNAAYTLSMNGFYDSALLQAVKDPDTNVSGAHIITVALGGNNRAAPVALASGGLKTHIQKLIASQTLTKATLDFVVNSIDPAGAVSAALVGELAQRTTAANNDANYVDFLAAAPNGGSVYLQCTQLALGAATNLVVTLRHSTDHAAWNDHANGVFTALTAVGAQRLAIAANINRYLSFSWAWTGGAGTSATFLVAFVPNP